MRIGIDVGGTNLKAGAVTEDGEVRSVCRMPAGDISTAGEFVHALSVLARNAAEQAGIAPQQTEAVGIGIPGAVQGDRVLYTCNLPLKEVPLGTLFRRELDVPVFLGNDADCAAIGEWCFGAGRGTRDFLTVTLGTGIGAGMILGGKLHTGMGAAGEAGHMVIHGDGLSCTCGRRGCWEQYASATGLIRRTRRRMTERPESLLHEVAAKNGAVDGRTAFEAAQRGDETALGICREYVEDLALGIVNLANLLHPERIAIGGGVADAPKELLLQPLQELVERNSYARYGGKITEIVKAKRGNEAGILGAALLQQVL